MIALSLETVCMACGAIVGIFFAQGAREFYNKMTLKKKKSVSIPLAPELPTVVHECEGGDEAPEEDEDDDDTDFGDVDIATDSDSECCPPPGKKNKKVIWTVPTNSLFHRSPSMTLLPRLGKEELAVLKSAKSADLSRVQPEVPETPPVTPEIAKP